LAAELWQGGEVNSEGCQAQRTATSSSLIVRRTCLSIVGDQAFPVAAAPTWNGLPPRVTSASSLPVFRVRLKTYLPTFSHSPSYTLLQSARSRSEFCRLDRAFIALCLKAADDAFQLVAVVQAVVSSVEASLNVDILAISTRELLVHAGSPEGEGESMVGILPDLLTSALHD